MIRVGTDENSLHEQIPGYIYDGREVLCWRIVTFNTPNLEVHGVFFSTRHTLPHYMFCPSTERFGINPRARAGRQVIEEDHSPPAGKIKVLVLYTW